MCDTVPKPPRADERAAQEQMRWAAAFKDDGAEYAGEAPNIELSLRSLQEDYFKDSVDVRRIRPAGVGCDRCGALPSWAR